MGLLAIIYNNVQTKEIKDSLKEKWLDQIEQTDYEQ
jgi:hypothetical protein